ncbi:hypothetical protein BpHYR1_013652 [Brachionus plicatilis]|uniref:Uncharacterized protein n=1 Tax=Brachionus plicatilis TaxID=10195 RepID=A0A3M7SX95_BRAPC|nr:hypothetical protein BpHYR1_013652 [Brachionus plicatilis]
MPQNEYFLKVLYLFCIKSFCEICSKIISNSPNGLRESLIGKGSKNTQFDLRNHFLSNNSNENLLKPNVKLKLFIRKLYMIFAISFINFFLSNYLSIQGFDLPKYEHKQVYHEENI